MKLIKIQQIFPLISNIMESYNEFTTLESVERKGLAWFEKLEGQNLDFVEKSIKEWDGDKMPTVIDILKKCRSLEKEKQMGKQNFSINDSTDDFFCEYYKFHDEEECEKSKKLCSNNNAEGNYLVVNLNGENIKVCFWHSNVASAKYSTDKFKKDWSMSYVSHILECYEDYAHFYTKKERTKEDIKSMIAKLTGWRQ